MLMSQRSFLIEIEIPRMHGHGLGVSAQPVRVSVCEPHAACRWPQPEKPSVPRRPGPQAGMARGTRLGELDRMVTVARRPLCKRGGTASQSSGSRRRHRPGGPGLWPRVELGGPCTVGPLSVRVRVPPSLATVGHGPLGAPCTHINSATSTLSPPLRRPGVPEIMVRGRGRVERGGGSSLQTFGTASGPDSEFPIYACKV